TRSRRSTTAEVVSWPRSRRRSSRRWMPARNASPASGRRAYSVSGTPWSASSSARPPPICPSPTIPTGPLVKQNLTPHHPGDQVDQLPERLHGVSAAEPRQLARVDRHLVLPL